MLPKTLYINAHTHQAGNETTLSVINIYPADRNKIVPGKHYSMGIHPWFIPGKGTGKSLRELEEFARMEEVVAIGECGLDKLANADIDLQLYVFERQVEIAEKAGKPLIIHCVRSFNEIVQVKKNSGSTVGWIIHGFNSNLDIADLLIRHEMYFSFGKALLNPQSNACKVLPQLEDESYLLETDDSTVPIEDIYLQAARLAGMDIETMKLSMMTNFTNIFKI
jgi:TatD DNase family protein